MIKLYTDGSLKQHDKKPLIVSWGFVVIDDGKEIYCDCGRVTGPPEFLKQRNVAGELSAVMHGLIWVLENGYKKVEVVHDYLGCSAWPEKIWEAKNKYSKYYKDFIQSMMNQIKIKFKPIKGHGKNKSEFDNKWNDRADELAKLGIQK